MANQSNFNEINQGFLQQITSLKEIIPFIMILINANKFKADKDYIDFVNNHGKKEKDDKGEQYFSFSPEDSHNVLALEENAKIANTASDIIPCSLFVSLVSQFDSFIGKIIKEIFRTKPEILNSSEKKITYSKLQDIKNIEEAKEFIIESEVDSILRESHSDHFDWLENKLNISLRKNFPVWSNFIELTERRNLFVHCDGIVSSQYLSNCRKNNVFNGSEPKIGEKLIVKSEYFENAYKSLFEISVKLSQVIWRKLLPNDLEKADEGLNDVCFDLIKSNQFELADNLLIFATETLKKHFNEESKNVFIVNKALSLKLGGKKEKADEIVDAKDWSACSDKFKIAKWALLDNFEEVGKLMKRIGADGEIKKVSYKTWPLFQEFRKTKIFLDCFKEVFNEDYFLMETPKKLFDQFIHDLKASRTKEDRKAEKEGLTPLNIVSFIEISSKYFQNYRFIHYRVDVFLKEINSLSKQFFTEDLTKAFENSFQTVVKFNKDLVIQSPTQYLNPYTMIRHCLYLYNKEKFHRILFDTQKNSFDLWLGQSKN